MPTLDELGAGWPLGTSATTLNSIGDDALQRWRAQVFNNPALVDRLLRYTRAEVGGQGPQAQRAFMEAMSNMAGNRGTFLPPSYFPGVTHTRAARPLTEDERAKLAPIAAEVAAGSNTAKYATGNASGSVGFGKGGYRTASYGGENYGVEAPDLNWWEKLGAQAPAPLSGAVPYINPAGVPTGATTNPAELQPQTTPRSWGDILASVAANFGQNKAPKVKLDLGNPLGEQRPVAFAPIGGQGGVRAYAR